MQYVIDSIRQTGLFMLTDQHPAAPGQIVLEGPGGWLYWPDDVLPVTSGPGKTSHMTAADLVTTWSDHPFRPEAAVEFAQRFLAQMPCDLSHGDLAAV